MVYDLLLRDDCTQASEEEGTSMDIVPWQSTEEAYTEPTYSEAAVGRAPPADTAFRSR